VTLWSALAAAVGRRVRGYSYALRWPALLARSDHSIAALVEILTRMFEMKPRSARRAPRTDGFLSGVFAALRSPRFRVARRSG